jgi:antitoxin component of RelBE/YafQ-DinJ toxin-antitoxin module
VSDKKRARPEVIKARTATNTKHALHAEADSRNITFSEMVDLVLEAHASHRRLAAPQARGVNSAALQELARLGNNLNQLARQAHLMRLPLLEREVRAVLTSINETARRLAA